MSRPSRAASAVMQRATVASSKWVIKVRALTARGKGSCVGEHEKQWRIDEMLDYVLHRGVRDLRSSVRVVRIHHSAFVAVVF